MDVIRLSDSIIKEAIKNHYDIGRIKSISHLGEGHESDNSKVVTDKGEFAIKGGFAGFYPDFRFNTLDYGLAVLEKAGQAFANPDYIPALRLGREKGIEGSYSVDITHGEAE